MSTIETSPAVVDESFAQIAEADIEAILKKLTQDEKVALLTGSPIPIAYAKRKEKRD